MGSIYNSLLAGKKVIEEDNAEFLFIVCTNGIYIGKKYIINEQRDYPNQDDAFGIQYNTLNARSDFSETILLTDVTMFVEGKQLYTPSVSLATANIVSISVVTYEQSQLFKEPIFA